MKKHFSNFLLKAAMAVIIISVTFFLTTCQSMPSSVVQEPQFKVLSTDFVNISLNNGIQMLSKVQVTNPNSFKIPYPETDWSLFVNNSTSSFLNGTVKKGQDIIARGSAVIDVPFTVDFVRLINEASVLRGSQHVPYKIAMGMKFNIPVLGVKSYDLEHQGQLPLPQQPVITNPSINMGSFDLTRAVLNVSMNIVNPNDFQLPAPKITYDYIINNNSFIKGSSQNDSPLAAKSTTPFNFQLQVTYADLFRSFASLMTASNAATRLNYTIDWAVPSALNWNNAASQIPFTLPIRR